MSSRLGKALGTILIVFVLAFAMRTFALELFWIPTSSMEPNLLVNDRIIAHRLLYDVSDVKRGHVIVFESPLNPKKRYVKRAIGLPGDELTIKNKKVYINGKLLREPYVVHSDNHNKGFPRDKFGPIKVPADSLFVLGDNRDSSADSRYWGFVPAENIVGQAILLYWPPWRIRIIEGSR